jgi:hypothetical protein
VPVSNWSIPETTTRIGASHARRGVVCQDASGCCSLQDRSGKPVHLMVVADGHGGKRYTQSDVGSKLACEMALNVLTEQLAKWSSVGNGSPQRWQEWLEGPFPKALHQRWLAAIEDHWKQDPELSETAFSPVPYGTTLALVVMTLAWWAHSGLGDWDLVRITADGEAELVNQEEEEDQTGGEATFSLCLRNAPQHFAGRTAVYPIDKQEPDFSLLLSTDGVRKSCSTDTDFLKIASYLCEAGQPREGDIAEQLNADLDRISSQGSGDDVSIAIGRWRSTGSSTTELPKAVSKPSVPLIRKGNLKRHLLIWLLVVLATGSGTLAYARFSGWRPNFTWFRIGPSPAPETEIALTRLVKKLCKQPDRIDDLLDDHGKQSFTQLRDNPERRSILLNKALNREEGQQVQALVAWTMAPSTPWSQKVGELQLQKLKACSALIKQTTSALTQWQSQAVGNRSRQTSAHLPSQPVQAPTEPPEIEEKNGSGTETGEEKTKGQPRPTSTSK